MGIWSFVKDAGASLFGGKAEAAEVQEEALKKEIEGLGLDAKDVQLKVEGDTVKVTGTARTAEDQEKLILYYTATIRSSLFGIISDCVKYGGPVDQVL